MDCGLQGFDTELSAKSALMAEINAVADDLISNNGSNTIEVKKSRKELNERFVDNYFQHIALVNQMQNSISVDVRTIFRSKSSSNLNLS